MKFFDLLSMSVSNLWRRKLRTFLTVLGVVIGTASIVVMVSIGIGMNRSMMQQIDEYGGLTTINVYSGDSYYGGGMAVAVSESGSSSGSQTEPVRLNDEMLQVLSGLEHVESVTPILSVDCLAKSGKYMANLSVRGIPAELLAQMNNMEVGQGTLPMPGDKELKFFYGNTVITDFYIEKTYQYYWETGVIPEIDFMEDPMYIIFDMDAYYASQYPSGDGTVTPPPKKYMVEACGVMAGDVEYYGANSSYVFCDLELLKEQLQRVFKNKAIPGQPTTATGKPYKEIYYNQVDVKVDDMDYMKDVQTQIQNLGLSASSNAEWIESQQESSNNLQMALGGIGAVSLFVAAIGIANTMMMSIYERTKEIGIIKVLGCDMRNIRSMFLMEAGFIGFVGGTVGILLSYGISFLVNYVASGQMGMAMGTGGAAEISYIPLWMPPVAIGFAILVGMLAGFFPALRAMKLSPLAAIRNE